MVWQISDIKACRFSQAFVDMALKKRKMSISGLLP